MAPTVPTDSSTGRQPSVYLHVGVPKTGTTFIQDVLWRRREALAAEGVCYPLQQRTEHFAATMDLRSASWNGRRNPEWSGTWDRLAGAVVDSGAERAVLSGELLAAADVAAAERAVASFSGWEVHVVVTARDLARQLVSEWQEQLKHRVSVPLTDFVAETLAAERADARSHRLGRAFWQLHDLPAVLSRWGSAVSPDRVHLVTVPPSGASGESLWDRFAAVVGIDPAHGTLPKARANTAMRAVEAELLRRANAAGLDRLDAQHYDRVVRVLLAEKVLAGQPGRPLVLPAQFAQQVQAVAGRQVEALAAGGYHVVGDLRDLVPNAAALGSAPGPPPGPPPGDEELAPAGSRAVAAFAAELEPLQRRLRARVGDAAQVHRDGADDPLGAGALRRAEDLGARASAAAAAAPSPQVALQITVDALVDLAGTAVAMRAAAGVGEGAPAEPGVPVVALVATTVRRLVGRARSLGRGPARW